MSDSNDAHEGGIHLPDPSPWPLAMAAGLALLVGGFMIGPQVTLFTLSVEKEVFEAGGGGKLAFPVTLGALSLVGLALFFLALYKLIREDIVLHKTGKHA